METPCWSPSEGLQHGDRKPVDNNLDLALSCSNFLVPLKSKIGSVQFLKERGRLLNKPAASS